jgi:hypothetical protein
MHKRTKPHGFRFTLTLEELARIRETPRLQDPPKSETRKDKS